ncbi:NYN domain-containing protein [Aliisedimentitalea scapharcae]|uniref:NYN domain-containing protein n=1 Tax=Aliisedimentitalea scapharcae TaxID=1524259 RepID=A0ABZ2XUP5_9RHOB
MNERDQPLLATLIDADNVPAKFAEAILKEVASIGEPALRRVYGDWTSGRLKGWSEKILKLGLVAHQQTANTSGKNASDIGLVIDAMDILHGRRFDGFVLVSSDSDFTSLANRLREDGLTVIGIGEKKTPEPLRNVCNRFIFIENLIADEEPTDAKKPLSAKEHPNKAAKLLLEAMERIQQEDEWFHLGQLGQSVVASHPDFDARSYGKSKLSELVSAINIFESKREGNSVFVREVKRQAKK